jgi:hypothetical protein
MDPTGIVRETGATTRSFFDALKDQPLSLALVVMNFSLVAFLFYSNSQVLTQRKDALDQIVAWQKATDTLMANCVSKDVMDSVMKALQEQLRSLRREINGGRDAPHDPPPRPRPRPQEAPPPIPPDEANRP